MKFFGIVLQRTGYGLLLLLAVLILNFFLIHLAPGDVADTIVGDMGGATEEVMAEIRATYGLDRPLIEQLWVYLSKVVVLDLGHSFFFNQPVTELIFERLPATLLLVITSQLIAIFCGTILGVISAQNPNGWFSHGVTVFSLLGYAAPVFWTGLMFIILFTKVLPLFPVAGMMNVAIEGGFWVRALDIAHHLVLPVLTLSTIYFAAYSRISRASMLDVLGADYVRTARAKGLEERVVVYKHALRNAVLPVITIAGLQFSQIVSGAVLVETVFSWPGLGTLALEAILGRDTPTILGILFFSSLIVVVANILTDLTYRVIDPRIRASNQ